MTAENPVRRTMTAKEAAKRFGVSERSIRRIAAEPREQFLARAAERRARALSMREQGESYAAIGEELGCSESAARTLVFHARRVAKERATG